MQITFEKLKRKPSILSRENLRYLPAELITVKDGKENRRMTYEYNNDYVASNLNKKSGYGANFDENGCLIHYCRFVDGKCTKDFYLDQTQRIALFVSGLASWFYSNGTISINTHFGEETEEEKTTLSFDEWSMQCIRKIETNP